MNTRNDEYTQTVWRVQNLVPYGWNYYTVYSKMIRDANWDILPRPLHTRLNRKFIFTIVSYHLLYMYTFTSRTIWTQINGIIIIFDIGHDVCDWVFTAAYQRYQFTRVLKNTFNFVGIFSSSELFASSRWVCRAVVFISLNRMFHYIPLQN